jgi:hypothetical protein
LVEIFRKRGNEENQGVDERIILTFRLRKLNILEIG